ncbi:hypothetical protein [Dactylosporangium matsuzakiense]|uniref:hypothetical protein n=1 Tax=Dactylosporangium matsuzakiense TaxID=53360 RepID=UPI0021C39533|nr:hypothetical protein [Dactylosporangium matsuzakiense]UWZ45862.1 hypothetical protein Dmats_05095 [Dactylosporangium matsuzakiense]
MIADGGDEHRAGALARLLTEPMRLGGSFADGVLVAAGDPTAIRCRRVTRCLTVRVHDTPFAAGWWRC